jgi:hypothetical protein
MKAFDFMEYKQKKWKELARKVYAGDSSRIGEIDRAVDAYFVRGRFDESEDFESEVDVGNFDKAIERDMLIDAMFWSGPWPEFCPFCMNRGEVDGCGDCAYGQRMGNCNLDNSEYHKVWRVFD